MSNANEVFEHRFGGYHRGKAKRWVNANGEPGGVVSVDAIVDPTAIIREGAEVWSRASIGHRASIGYGASIGPQASIGGGASIGPEASIGHRASIGYEASIGYGASIEKGDWFITVGPLGSRNATTTAVYSPARDELRWWVGCQCGITTEALLARIQGEHADNDHGHDYRHLIDFVTSHPAIARCKLAYDLAKSNAEVV